MSYFSSLATVQIIILSVIVMIIIYFTIPWNNRQSPHRPRWCVEGGTFYAVDICLPHLKMFVEYLCTPTENICEAFLKYLYTEPTFFICQNLSFYKQSEEKNIHILGGGGAPGKLRIPRDITGRGWWYAEKLMIPSEWQKRGEYPEDCFQNRGCSALWRQPSHHLPWWTVARTRLTDALQNLDSESLLSRQKLKDGRFCFFGKFFRGQTIFSSLSLYLLCIESGGSLR